LLAVPGFAPFSFYPLTILALAILFVQWTRVASPRAAAGVGFAFGLGLFGAGIAWIYVALHDYGGMPLPLAVLATGLFAAFIALFPALAGYAQARFATTTWARVALLMPALWTFSEWLRGTLFTGFPWLSFGYSQVAASPLAGYAPVFGVYGTSLVVAVSAGLLAVLWLLRWSRAGKIALLMTLVLWAGGAALRVMEWTQPQGDVFRVALLQGNIPQEVKFRQGGLDGTLTAYRDLIRQSDARLIVLPETALPVLREELPASYALSLLEFGRQQGSDILIGAFEREDDRYFNSVFSLGASPSQSYRKHHLVPFGEFIPLRPVLGWFINEVLHIPMGDLTRGDAHQPPLKVAGQQVAVDICYEDVFGEEIIRALPAATILVNVSNDAWYGHSAAAMQHNQIAQMRALESGRMMLRATNTGVTSVIDRDGRIKQMLPQHEAGMLTAVVQGYTGSTPYVRWGNAPVLLLAVLMAAASVLLRKR
ncbi:MAG: apolipoprotein N-acyltransferase, partial [Gallionellaceae bacterium]|nr:apolipoprotein N-acyltransferase [Gallionellaceae bacterium]